MNGTIINIYLNNMLSSHFGKTTPPNNWLAITTDVLNKHQLSPSFAKQIYDKGYRNIYISSSYNNNNKFHTYFQTLNSTDFEILKSVQFEVVLIDSLNAIHPNMMKVMPCNICVMGLNKWAFDSTNYEECKLLTCKNIELTNSIIKEYGSFPNNNYSYQRWFCLDKINYVLDKERTLSPEELHFKKLKEERESSKFGTLIEILNKYSIDNWVCITKNTKIDPKYFELKYNYMAQAMIQQCDITYKYNNNTFTGGKIVSPNEPISRFEFEYFFGFGPKCSNFDKNITKYFYQNSLKLYKTNHCHNIYKFLEPYQDDIWNIEFYKFIVWISINYLGILNSHKENECITKLGLAMDLEPLSDTQIEDLIYPLPPFV